MAYVKLNNEMLSELQRAFSLKDYDEDGKIFTEDVGQVVRSVKGLKPSQAEVRDMEAQVQNKGGMVTLKDLVALISQTVTQPDADRADDLATMFKMYDKQGSGLISIADLRHLLTTVGEKLTDAEADDLIKLSGCVERGQVNYYKFTQVVMGS